MPENKNENDLRSARGIIWDLDNTLYRFEGDFEHLCHVAAAKAALKGGLPMNYEEALSLCLRSYAEHGHSYHLLLERNDVDRRQMHFDFHDFIDEKIIRRSISLIGLFESAPLEHVLLTHASRGWAVRALDHLGLKTFFPDDRIIPAEDVDFLRKSSSRIPFEKALSLLGTNPEETLVVEDIADNLRIPYEMGLRTVLVHYGRPPEPMPNHVWMDFHNAADFLSSFMEEKIKARPDESCTRSKPSS